MYQNAGTVEQKKRRLTLLHYMHSRIICSVLFTGFLCERMNDLIEKIKNQERSTVHNNTSPPTCATLDSHALSFEN